MHLILTGATGLVGSSVLDAMIKMKDISKISILSRRPVPMAEDAKDPRISVIIHKDYEKYDSELLGKLKGAKGCVWALGISQTQVGTEEYIRITKTCSLAAAKAFQTLTPPGEGPFNFVYVSAGGATTDPGTFTQSFARVKGEVEVALADMRREDPDFRAVSARPLSVDASAHDAVRPYLPAPPLSTRVLMQVLGPPIRTVFTRYHSPTEHLGRVLAELALGRFEGRFVAGQDIQMIGEFPILENTALRRFAGLS
ncbi:hypothetical protein VPNG_00940 [Cytospora leucostoma]|uniref:NAD(P)-binding domain-containing protein n=1 Tax=Cytospora leucostoma TaxID=1230097 RepID=A0A423XLM5_9PEZI|nr:hypothetical protein VPNG_00940 [Cytospora leucostoma]